MVSFYPFNWIPRESVCKLIVFLLKGQDQKTCVGRKHGPRGSDSTLKCWALWLPKSDRVDLNGLWDSRRTNPLHSPLEDHMGTIPSELETNSSGAMSHYGGQGSLWGKKDDPGHRQLIPSQSCSGHLTFDSPKALRTEPGSKENQNLALQELILRKERKAWIQVTGNQDKELLKYIYSFEQLFLARCCLHMPCCLCSTQPWEVVYGENQGPGGEGSCPKQHNRWAGS